MNLILLVFMFSNLFSFSKSFIDKSLVKCVDSKKLRNILHEYTNDKYSYIPYTKIKKIIHDEINCIDIYGNELMLVAIILNAVIFTMMFILCLEEIGDFVVKKVGKKERRLIANK